MIDARLYPEKCRTMTMVMGVWGLSVTSRTAAP
jgi:hypothetical protein